MPVRRDESSRATVDEETGAEISGPALPRPVLLSIAGFDPSSGAGVTADLKVFASHGLYGMACITALTVQSTVGVKAVRAVNPSTVASTLQMLAEDATFSGIKIGMLATAAVCKIVASFLHSLPEVPVVLDPVLCSSSGRELLGVEGVGMLRERLLARVDWITPNLEELSTLTGTTVSRRDDVPAAAEKLWRRAQEMGNKRLNVLVTGGHLEIPEDFLLAATGATLWIPEKRVETNATHGTGCALSSALLCRLVEGDSPTVAATRAKQYVTAALKAAYPVGRGKGPMDHFFGFTRKAS